MSFVWILAPTLAEVYRVPSPQECSTGVKSIPSNSRLGGQSNKPKNHPLGQQQDMDFQGEPANSQNSQAGDSVLGSQG